MRKEEIKAKALTLFSHKGFFGCSVQEIANAVGINKATLYFYFPSKEALFLEILDEQLDIYVESMREAAQKYKEAPLKESFFQMARILAANSTQEMLLLWRYSLHVSLGEVDDEFRNALRTKIIESDRKIMDTISIILNHKKLDLGRGDVQKLLVSYFLFTQGLMDWMMINMFFMKKDIESSLQEMWEGFWHGNAIEEPD